MTSNPYSYALMLYRQSGDPLGQVPVTVDWEPAEECARFEGVRRGLLEPAEKPGASILPLWSEQAGEPYLQGFRVALGRPGAAGLSHDFPPAYFRDPAVRASTDLVARGVLAQGEVFRYRAVAFPAREEPARPRRGFVTEEGIPSVPLRATRMASLARRAAPIGEPGPEDLPVYVPRRILEEAADLTRGAGEQETGGILIGHLHRDASVPEVFVEVTAQIPAPHTQADLTRLTFTADTWTALQAALDLRRRGEVMLGWWHSHPSRIWCGECPEERRRTCPYAGDFFSEHDRMLHRTVFPRAYSVALVVTDAAGGLSYSMFGWRGGLVARRGFHVTGAARTAASPSRNPDPSPDPEGDSDVSPHETCGRASSAVRSADCGRGHPGGP